MMHLREEPYTLLLRCPIRSAAALWLLFISSAPPLCPEFHLLGSRPEKPVSVSELSSDHIYPHISSYLFRVYLWLSLCLTQNQDVLDQ